MSKFDYDKESGDQIWLVFDVDDYYKQNQQKFKKGIKTALDNGLELAWSNECFELWVLLHFQELKTEISRQEYHTKLKKHFKLIGKEYVKNSNVFSDIINFQEKAIKNSIQLFHNDIATNPSTSIHYLIKELNNLRP